MSPKSAKKCLIFLNMSKYTEIYKIFTKKLNKDLLDLSFWLHANKIGSNVPKTEVIPFKTKCKILDKEVKLKLCRKQLH